MRNRTMVLIIALLVLGLLAVGGTVGAMAMTQKWIYDERLWQWDDG